MSDQKNISPLLDGFTLGAPISEHHGVICHPAIKENSNKKYIVKVISVPANQAQFDAMLLAGAYKDPGDAMEYFRKNGESILNEAELLKKLSRIEGFLPYDGWQMEPITRRRLGYEVYLVGSYKRSLDKYIRKHAFTHLEAINLGLDLCSALTVSRQSGYLYVDLKPCNIYVSENKEFRIGDLGFLSLDSLRYASLPERYFSPYTPPELLDPMAEMNLTVDTYAVGMILYQLYNDGVLPFSGTAPAEGLPVPCHADYEMAEIIMKAIHSDPAQRWTDPKDLGKAIASYMQRNSVNDVPITPFIPPEVNPEDRIAVSPESEPEQELVPEPEESVLEEESVDEADIPEQTEITASDESSDLPEEEVAPDEVIPENTEPVSEPEDSLPQATEEDVEQEIPSAEVKEIPEFLSETGVLSDPDISEEVSRIISKADDIIAHEIPSETSFPTEEQSDPFAFVKEDAEEIEDDLPADPLMDDDAPVEKPVKTKKPKSFENTQRKEKFKKFLFRFLSILLLTGASVIGFWYYQNFFLQPIDSLSLNGTQDTITVLVDTSVDESKLTVYCVDPDGKQKSAAVQGGKAEFTGLKPSTAYTIELDMSGFHKLVGMTSDVFITEAKTQVLSFQAIAGSEDGSVLLDFTVEGGEPDFWNIRYTAEGEEERMETVTGHTASISGLTLGKMYTFTLDGGKNFDLGGETTLQYMASRLILAEDLSITSEDDGGIVVHWNIPGDVVVEHWNIRCYDGYGFEEKVTVTENEVRFTGLDPSREYTVEVTAAGMTQPSRIRISADPILVSEFRMEEKSKTEINVSWEYTGTKPEAGWLLIYTVDGSGSQVITCEKTTAVISPLIPGANYAFTLQAADSRTVFNNTADYQASEAEAYTANAYVSENVSIDLLKTPEDSKWTFETVTEDAFTNRFCIGDSASMVLRSTTALYYPGSKTKVLFVYRDAYGNALPELSAETSLIWKNIWLAGDSKNGEIDIPQLPSVPGNYVMELYFDGCFVKTFEITITE